MAGSTTTTTVGSKLAGMSIQTALLGQPIPIGWGRGKLSCNLIDYLNFTAIPHTTTTTTGGGKGGSSTSTNTTYTYSADVLMSIAQGPITGINAVWKDAAHVSGASSLSTAGLNLMTGTTSQTAWPYLTTAAPTHALGYRTIAYTYAQAYDLGSNGVVANHSFEVDFAIQFNNAGGVYDANPKDILTDFLTNTTYGVPSWPANSLGDWTQWSNYCVASGLLLSPVLDQTVAGSAFVKQLMDETNSDCFWSEGLLKVVPLGDTSATGNGVTYTPNLTPVYALDERSLLGEVSLEISDQSAAFNYVQVEYLDRSNEYANAVTIAYDQSDIITYGRREQTATQFHDICDAQVARNVAQLWLQRNLYIRDKYNFDLPQDFIALEPRDYVTLTTTVDGLALNAQLVSILEIHEDQDGSDILHIVAEGVPGHTASHAAYTSHVSGGYAPNVNADPGNVATPVLFNAPPILASRGYQACAAVAGTNSNWGGCFVWISFDGTNYSRVGQQMGPSRYGVLTTTLGNVADPDTTSTLGVDLTISGASLGSVTNAEADNLATLFLVDSELMSYGTATLTATSKYNLTYLRRGKQTPIASHSIGANFVRIDDGLFRVPFTAANAGATMSVKFQSFNVYGRALQDLSTVNVYTLVLGSATLLPSAASVTAEYRANIIRWTNPTTADLSYVQVFASTTNSVGAATLVGQSITGEYTHQNLTGGATWYYWIAAVDYANNVSAKVSAGSGTALSIALYEGIGADGTLTPAEKQLIIREWTQLSGEQSNFDSEATTYGITTEKTNYDNAVSTLSTYLTGLSPAYNDTTQNTTIVRTTWNSNWSSLYSTRALLESKINAVAATLAQWPNITDTTGTIPDPNATGGDTYVPDSSFDSGTGTGFGPNWAADSRWQRADLP